MPSSHQIIKGLEFNDFELGFEPIQKSIKEGAISMFKKAYEDSKSLLSCYLWITVLSIIFDILHFLRVLSGIGAKGSEVGVIVLFMFCLIFIGCNLYWVSWAI